MRAGLLALLALGCAPRAVPTTPPPAAPPPVSPPSSSEAPEVASAPPAVSPAPMPPPSSTAAAPAAGPVRVIVVTTDGVRWQDVFEARAWPRTWALVERSGVALGNARAGKRCGLVRPRNTTHISLPGYLEIFTGHRTTCMSNVCPQVVEATVFDVAAAAGVSTASISSWDVLDHAVTHRRAALYPATDRPGPRDAFVSAGTRFPGPRPLEDPRLEEAVALGERAKPAPALGGPYRPDRYTGKIALEYLRVRRPRLLHVGLGDTDELAHRDDRAGYEMALRAMDGFVAELAAELEALDLTRSTVVVIVSDHGRADSLFREHGPTWPESGRSFVLAFGGPVPKQGEVCAPRDLWLTDVAATVRALLGLPRDATPESAGSPIEAILPRSLAQSQ